MAEERPFEVVDKRRVQAGGEAADAPAETFGSDELDGEEVLSEEDLAEQLGGGGFPSPLALSVGQILRMNIGLLADKAWIGMGLIPDPTTGKTEPQFQEARRAIDILADLARHAQADATPEEQRELQRMLADLRANFVQKSGGR